MSYALGRVADEMREVLAKYHIEVRANERVILYEDRAVKLKPYTTSREAKKVLNQFVKDARLKVEQQQQAKQSNLFEGT